MRPSTQMKPSIRIKSHKESKRCHSIEARSPMEILKGTLVKESLRQSSLEKKVNRYRHQNDSIDNHIRETTNKSICSSIGFYDASSMMNERHPQPPSKEQLRNLLDKSVKQKQDIIKRLQKLKKINKFNFRLITPKKKRLTTFI